jgi:23S rRNA (guanine745-N1)-methyltransferase
MIATALADVVPLLTCPICSQAVRIVAQALHCPCGHTFDVARAGYVNLLPGNTQASTADTADMVRARERFLAAGHYAPLAELIAGLAGRLVDHHGLVVDAGAGTGYYLRAVLDRCHGTGGLALDLSKFAARRAARAHPKAATAVADLWGALPIQSHAAALLLNVFAPRNAAEFHRILRPGGTLLVVTPGVGHLAELVAALGLISVDNHKTDRLHHTLTAHFLPESRQAHTTSLRLSPAEVEHLVAMGPSARHLDLQQLPRRVAALGTPYTVTASFTLSVFRRR